MGTRTESAFGLLGAVAVFMVILLIALIINTVYANDVMKGVESKTSIVEEIKSEGDFILVDTDDEKGLVFSTNSKNVNMALTPTIGSKITYKIYPEDKMNLEGNVKNRLIKVENKYEGD